MAQKPIEGQSLPTDYWLHVHLSIEIKDHPASLRVTCGQQVSFPSLCWFLRPGLLIGATQIPHDAEMTTNPYAGRKFLTHRESNQRRIL